MGKIEREMAGGNESPEYFKNVWDIKTSLVTDSAAVHDPEALNAPYQPSHCMPEWVIHSFHFLIMTSMPIPVLALMGGRRQKSLWEISKVP